jgi:hypothetical protein
MSESQKPLEYAEAYRQSLEHGEKINSLVHQIALILVQKEGGSLETQVDQAYHVLQAYPSINHISILEGMLDILKSNPEVVTLLNNARASVIETLNSSQS